MTDARTNEAPPEAGGVAPANAQRLAATEVLLIAAATALLVFGGYLYTVRRVLGQVGVVTPELWFTEWTVPWEYSWWLIAAIGMFLLTLLSDWEWGQCVASNVALLVALP